jgi:hypothetical protein
MDQQVLRPVFQILLRCQSVPVLADLFSVVIRKPLVELVEVFRDDKPVASNMSTISRREGIRLVRLLFNRYGGVWLEVMFRRSDNR